MNPIYISPSILAADFSRLGEQVASAESAGAELLHLDVMDGHFVPNISFGPAVIASLRPHSRLIFDTHLMISEPERYIDDFIHAGSDMITFHIESSSDPVLLIRRIKRAGIRASIAISPDTPADVLIPYLPMLDMVLVMTVKPGYGGQKLMPETLPKVSELRRIIDRDGICCDIEVDGGIGQNNAGLVSAAGANVIVAGSAIFGAPDCRAAIEGIRSAAHANPFIG